MMIDCTAMISACITAEALMMAERCNGSTRNRSMMPRSISSSTVMPLHMLDHLAEQGAEQEQPDHRLDQHDDQVGGLAGDRPELPAGHPGGMRGNAQHI